jgi:ribosome biogenesis GTPase
MGTFNCTLRGLMKKDNTQMKNLVTVGDFVWIEKIGEGEGLVAAVDERNTVLSRADNLSRRKEQLIAANVDQVLITSSVVSPPIKYPLIDRYIIAAYKGGMVPVVVINKIDLLKGYGGDQELIEQERVAYQGLVEAYKKADVTLIGTSVTTGEGMDLLKSVMKDKVSVFSGQSGVGKSSLINAVAGYDLLTGGIVDKTKKGAHTTSSTKLLPLSFGGWCVDTPGIKSFGVWQLDKDEVEHYFDEIFTCGHDCRFPDCSHTGEEGCAVVKAVENGEISPMRYSSYRALLDSLEDHHRRR